MHLQLLHLHLQLSGGNAALPAACLQMRTSGLSVADSALALLPQRADRRRGHLQASSSQTRRLGSCRAGRAPTTSDTVVSADNISKSHDGLKILFNDLTFSVCRGERMAIIGANGSGKTSLLRIMANADFPDDGDLTVKKNCQVGYLPQDADVPDGLTAFQAVCQADSPIVRTVRRYYDLLQKGDSAPRNVRFPPACTCSDL